jgi:hypothetical protein
VLQYRKNQALFVQGGSADAVFDVRTGEVKLTVVSLRGKAAIIASSEPVISSVKDVSRASRCAWRPRRPSPRRPL